MEYRTILAPSKAELTEKRSRFLAEIAHTCSEEEALAFLSAVRAKSREATHHVSAFIAGGVTRCSDDGEPQGTSGLPVLEVITGAGLKDVTVVVTRWFGGTLLGTGGLVRAYSQAARLAVTAADIVTMRRCAVFEIRCDYRRHKSVEGLARELMGDVLSRDYGELVTLRVYVPEESAGQLMDGVSEITLGGVRPEPRGYEDFPCPAEKLK